MCSDLKGKVKERVWLKPYCTDESDSFRLGQLARKDFKQHAKEEDCEDEETPIDIASPDLLDEALELTD